MRTCPTCGRLVVDPVAATCPNCGAALSAPAPQAPEWPQPTAPGAQQAEQTAAPTSGSPEYGHPAAPSQPMYPYPGYPPYPTAPSQPLYPYPGYPPQPAAPSQPMYPYGAYPPGANLPSGAYPPPYAQAPGANWRPGQERRGPSGLVITLIVALVVAVLGGIGYGAYALISPNGNGGAGVGLQSATPTATAPQNALLTDPLTSDTYGWSSSTSHCYFDQDGYHINNGYYCNAPIGAVADGRVTVTVEQITGSTLAPYGISFRVNMPDTHYLFAIDSNSKWVLFRVVNGQFARLRDYTYSAAIHGGLNSKNTLTVDFRGQHITCMVNGVTVGEVTDSGSSLGAGKIALEAGKNVNAVFTNFLALP